MAERTWLMLMSSSAITALLCYFSPLWYFSIDSSTTRILALLLDYWVCNVSALVWWVSRHVGSALTKTPYVRTGFATLSWMDSHLTHSPRPLRTDLNYWLVKVQPHMVTLSLRLKDYCLLGRAHLGLLSRTNTFTLASTNNWPSYGSQLASVCMSFLVTGKGWNLSTKSLPQPSVLSLSAT